MLRSLDVVTIVFPSSQGAFNWPEIGLIDREYDFWTGVGSSDTIFTNREFKPETPIIAIVFVCFDEYRWTTDVE